MDFRIDRSRECQNVKLSIQLTLQTESVEAYRSSYRCCVYGYDESVVGCRRSQVDAQLESCIEAVESGASPVVFEIEVRGDLRDIGRGRDLISIYGPTG